MMTKKWRMYKLYLLITLKMLHFTIRGIGEKEEDEEEGSGFW